jgi:hypothetical protein
MNIAVRASMRRESVYMLWCWMDNSWMKSGAGRASEIRMPSTEYGIASRSRFKE